MEGYSVFVGWAEQSCLNHHIAYNIYMIQQQFNQNSYPMREWHLENEKKLSNM